MEQLAELRSAEADIQKAKKQRDMDEPNLKALMEAVHDVLDTKRNNKSSAAPRSQ